jgi:phosphoglycolate phosphatase-like HAD superfamily hydrolase
VTSNQVSAVIWDFDGTLADTLQRNLEITRRILERLLGDSAGPFPVLRDRDSYARAIHRVSSWRELYVRELGVPPERTEDAAPLWTEFHEEDTDVPQLFDGVHDAVSGLDGRPQGIVSQNSRDHIIKSLGQAGLLSRFGTIVADEELPYHRQKPEPDGLLQCTEALLATDGAEPSGTILYVGDHPVDIECVRRASAELTRRGHSWRLLSVGVQYGAASERQWGSKPDFVANEPADIPVIVRQLES